MVRRQVWFRGVHEDSRSGSHGPEAHVLTGFLQGSLQPLRRWLWFNVEPHSLLGSPGLAIQRRLLRADDERIVARP